MHYIRLVVLGDSQVGKTSLIKQLVGQEFKFEPELREANKCEKRRQKLDASWHLSLHKHENDLEQSVKTKRLAALLASQLELQQHLLHQQRNGTNCSKNNPHRGSNKKLKCVKSEGSSCVGSCDKPAHEASKREKNEPANFENKQQEQQAFHKPTILISAINSCEKTENTNTSEQSIVGTVSLESPFISTDSILGGKKSRDEVGEQSSSAYSTIKPANQDSTDENCDQVNHSQCGRQPLLTITSSSSSPPTMATTSTTRNKPFRDDILLVENQVTNKDGNFNENSNSYPNESKNQIENHNEMVRKHHNHYHAAAQKHKSLETRKMGGQQVVRQQYRHSYCAPGEISNTQNEQHSGSPRKASQLNAKQTSELSTQAKIINILFTRSESKVEQVVGGGGGDDRISHQKSGKQMLMPSLLRQYQRRLSNFNQQANHSNTCQSNSSCIISSDQDSSRTMIDEELKESSIYTDHEQVISCARAAASLATAAASAAQAIVSQQARYNALARTRARCNQSTQTNSEREEVLHLSKSRSGLSLLVGSQVNLYSLTEEYKSKLKDEQYQHLLVDNERINSGPRLRNKQRIQHFCVNFMNNMHLYEINIVDMPPIEPVSFPTSSLLEWSLFRGQSHLLTADAYLLVFDLTRPSTIQYIKSLRDKIFESREMSNIPAYVIANKADLCPTLQLSLQARRMRNVAARRNQASVNNQSGQPNANTASSGATATSSTATPITSIGTKPNLLYSQPAFSHTPSTGRFLSSWTRFRRERRPTLDLGAQYSRAVPTKAAHQLLTAYKENRMRLGSSGPIISLRRWARLRRAIVRSNETNNVCNSAQWLQFERTRAQCKLAFGASGTTESGSSNQWVSNVGKALVRFKTHVNDRYRHLNRTEKSNNGRRRYKTKPDIYSRIQRRELDMFGKRRSPACCSKPGCRRKRKKKLRAERKKRIAKKLHDQASEEDLKKDKTSIGRFVTISRWFNNNQAAGIESRQQQSSEKSSKSKGARVSFPGCPVDDAITDKKGSFAIETSSSNLISGLKIFKASSKRAKRKHQDQSDSSGSKSSSLRSKSGFKRKQRVDGSFQQYSKLLTTAAKRNSLVENEQNNTTTSNFYQSSTSREWSPIGATNYTATNSTNIPAATSSSGRSQPAGEPIRSPGQIKPVSGFLGTTSSRQAFYELFNKLLQTSSTTVAKTQLTLSSIHGDDESQDNSCDKSRVGLQGQHVCRNEQRRIVTPSKVELLTISCAEGQKEEKRRKSSTGAALWQTLSSLALNRSSRVSSVCSNSSEALKRQVDQATSTLAQTAKAEVDQQNVRRTEGVQLGTDQYLSIDMLRKLSLISSSSQMSVGGGSTTIYVGQEQGESKSASEVNPDQFRPNSAPTLATNLKNRLLRDGRASTDSSSINYGKKDNICANSGQQADINHSSSRAKRIWYRGVMKKILFQSNKRSLKSIVTAARLQKHINDMYEAEQNEESSSLNKNSSCLGMKNNLVNDQSESGVMETTARIRVPTTIVTAETMSQTYDGPTNGSEIEESREILGAKQAPSIRIITSGSSLSLISSGNEDSRSVSNEKNIRKAASESSLDEGGGIQKETESEQAEDKVRLDSCQEGSRDWAKNQAELINDQTRACEIISSGQGEQPGEGVSSVAGSLSSLSESISLSAEIKQQAAQSCFYSSIEPRTKRAQSASAGKATSASTHLDSITETIDLNQAQSSETLNGQSSVSRNLSELQQPEMEELSGVRKLSADDCLIFNRQRRKSKAMLEGSEDNEESWLFVGQTNKHSNSAEPSVPSSLTRPKMFNTYQEEGNKQRNNNRNSIEMAAELLVPRVKGARSASITLGVNESQHKSLSQLGNTILGAMNVQRTWRHFLAKKKSSGSELVNNSNKITKPTQVSQYKKEESNVDFLNSNKAFTRLSLSQQREAVINFDQLMRINQLTLSASNLVMISNGRDGREPVKQNAIVSSEAKQQQQQQQQQAVGAVRDNNTAVTNASSLERRENRCSTSSKESMRNNRRTSGRQPQALMTRLQTGGNLLLGRNNTRRELKSVGDGLESCSFTDLGRCNMALSTANAIGGIEKVSSHHDERNLRSANSLVCLTPSVGVGNAAKFDMPEAKGGEVKQINETSFGQVLNFEPEEKSGLLQDDSNMSAEIANAAASALERQKRRGEELSLILEPRYDKKQAGAKYPLFVNNDLNPILKDLAQLVRKHWKCNYIECSAASNWNIKPIISELTRALECNRQTARRRARLDKQEHANEPNLFTSDDDSCNESHLRHDYERHLNEIDNYEYEEDEEEEEEDDDSDYEDEHEYESEDDGDCEDEEDEGKEEKAGAGEDGDGLRECSYCKGTNDSWWRSRRFRGRSRCLVKNRTNNRRKSETIRPNTLETIFQVATNKREKERRPLGSARLMTRRILNPPTKSGFPGTTNTRGRTIEMKHSSDCKILPEEEEKEEEEEEIEGSEIKSSSLAGPDKRRFLEHQAGYGRSLGQKREFVTKSSEVSSERPKRSLTNIHSSLITKRKREGSESKLESQNGTNCAIM